MIPLGPSQLNITVAALAERSGVSPSSLGLGVELAPLGEQTDDQRKGWHWLLGQWLELDPDIAKNREALKTRLLIAMFGAIKVTDRHGNESYIAARRTTQYWDWDMVPPNYRRKKLSKQLYSDLVHFTYDLAAEDGTNLPEMKKEHKEEIYLRETA